MPEGAVYVGRPTEWGNPVSLLDLGAQYPSLDDAQLHGMAVACFRDLVRVGELRYPNWLRFNGDRGLKVFTYPSVDRIRADLGGHDLVCWCDLDVPCHVDVLLELANAAHPAAHTLHETEESK
jgi:hypothetical protein